MSNQLLDVIMRTEAMIRISADIDVIIKTNDKKGDGYAFIYVDEEGKYDVSYLANRIPADAWKSEEGREEIRRIFESGHQTYSKESSLRDAINQVFSYWFVPKENQDFLAIELVDNNIQLVLLTESKKRK